MPEENLLEFKVARLGSEEWRRNISNAKRGKKIKPFTEEHRRELSKAMKGRNKGRTPWHKGRTNVYSKEALRKMSEAKKGKKNPMWGEHGHRIKLVILKCTNCDKPFKLLPSRAKKRVGYCSRLCANIAKWKNGRLAMRGKNNPMYGKSRPDFASRYGKKEEFERKKFRNMGLKPTRPERHLTKLIEDNNLPFKYVGDGSLLVGTCNPDFISTDETKKVIEMFGEKFHDPSNAIWEVPYNRTERGRVVLFANHGFDCLVIWEPELKDERAVVNKIERWSYA